MEENLLRVLQACVGAVVLLGTVILVFGLFPSVKSADGAAWVGAIGTVAAFFSAIGVARWQFSWEQRKTKREDEAKLQALLALAYDYAYQVTISTMRLQWPAPGVVVYPPPSSLGLNYTDIEKGIEAIPLHHLPSPVYVPFALLFRRYARTTAYDLDKCRKNMLDLKADDSKRRHTEEEIMRIRHRARYVLAEIRAGIHHFGSVPHEPPEHLTDIKSDWRGVLYEVP